MKLENFQSNFQVSYQKTRKIKLYYAKKRLVECTENCLYNPEYITCKSKLNQLCEKIGNIIRIRKKFEWYEDEENSTKL